VVPFFLKHVGTDKLWQRDRTKRDTFSINGQCYSQNHKIPFLGHPIGTSVAIQVLYTNVLMQKNFVAEFHRKNVSFTSKTELAFLSHPLWGLTCNACDSSLASWKARSRLRIGYNCTFFPSSYGWNTNASKSAFVERVGHFWAKYQVYRQHLYTVGYGNGSTTTLPLETFTQRNFVAVDWTWILLTKTTNSLIEPPFRFGEEEEEEEEESAMI